MLTALNTGAPGVFVPLDSPGDPGIGWVLLAAVGLFVAAAGLAAIPFDRSGRHLGYRRARAAGVALLGILIAYIGFTAAFAERDAVNAAAATHAGEYAASVSDWLADDYGIASDSDSVAALIAGESLATVYDGGRVVISLTKTTTGTYTIVDENETLLPLLSE